MPVVAISNVHCPAYYAGSFFRPSPTPMPTPMPRHFCLLSIVHCPLSIVHCPSSIVHRPISRFRFVCSRSPSGCETQFRRPKRRNRKPSPKPMPTPISRFRFVCLRSPSGCETQFRRPKRRNREPPHFAARNHLGEPILTAKI